MLKHILDEDDLSYYIDIEIGTKHRLVALKRALIFYIF